MNIDDWLLEILACPKCRAQLRADEAAAELVCTGCGWPTRCATTSRCCWWTRPGRPRGGESVGPAARGEYPHGGAAFAALRLDDPELVEAGDPGMLRQVAAAAAQVRTALRACDEATLAGLAVDARPRAIVVAGAGTGALAGEILAASVGARSPVQVLIVSGYGLPGWVGAADLVVAISASGQTVRCSALARRPRGAAAT